MDGAIGTDEPPNYELDLIKVHASMCNACRVDAASNAMKEVGCSIKKGDD
jgi:hypothetical protein